MWICPKCGRAFKRTNQGHYCGKAPETVDEYMKLQPAQAQSHISALRKILFSSVPELKERIAWSMPRYEKDTHSISFAACKKHISLYVDADILECFKSQLCEFEIKKNAVYLPYHRALPAEAIENIVKHCFAGN
ncbi:MAG: DUF1801 domain-containing protein [Clostridia bacterium]|nr:DUF1801 domain-containing protein [Clostridia bacterium]